MVKICCPYLTTHVSDSPIIQNDERREKANIIESGDIGFLIIVKINICRNFNVFCRNLYCYFLIMCYNVIKGAVCDG